MIYSGKSSDFGYHLGSDATEMKEGFPNADSEEQKIPCCAYCLTVFLTPPIKLQTWDARTIDFRKFTPFNRPAVFLMQRLNFSVFLEKQNYSLNL